MELFHALALVLAAGAVLFVLTHLRPLYPAEITQLARKRRGREIRRYFHFHFGQSGVNKEFKRQMDASGKFYRLDQTLFEFPSRVAGLLKYKKHEWVVVAFEKQKKIDLIWANKGFDRDSASIFLPADRTAVIACGENYDSVLVFHNHPNPYPTRYNCTRPSATDLNTAQRYANVLNPNGVNVVKFVCERGRPYEYFLSPAGSFLPQAHFESRVHETTGRSVIGNLRLHLERIFRREIRLPN